MNQAREDINCEEVYSMVLRVEEWVWQYLTPEFTSMRILRIE